MNRLNHGSIIPDMKYRNGRNEMPYIMAQSRPNRSSSILRPMLKSSSSVTMPIMALGRRAAASFTPNTFMLSACIQINRGGFSQKGSKLMRTLNQSPVTSISRADSAKLISSQSNSLTTPSPGMKNRAASNAIARFSSRVRFICGRG